MQEQAARKLVNARLKIVVMESAGHDLHNDHAPVVAAYIRSMMSAL
jgi:hypothetical protein